MNTFDYNLKTNIFLGYLIIYLRCERYLIFNLFGKDKNISIQIKHNTVDLIIRVIK